MGSKRNLILIIILLLGLGLGLFLITNQTVFRSRAGTAELAIEGPNVKTVNGELVAIPPQPNAPIPVDLRITTPFDAGVGASPTPPTQTATPSATPTTPPSASPSPGASELDTVIANYGRTVTPGTNGDLDNNGKVDALDYAIAYDRAPNKPSSRLPFELISTVEAQGAGGRSCDGYTEFCRDSQDRPGTMWCEPGVLNSDNQCDRSLRVNTTCYKERGSTERNVCNVFQTGADTPPSKPSVSISCSNNVPTATFNWTGTPGRAADADTANRGKTGFYVDISNNANFTLVGNKFIEGNNNTTDSTGFKIANADHPDVGRPYPLDTNRTYFVRVFNGRHSQTTEFNTSCQSTPPPVTSYGTYKIVETQDNRTVNETQPIVMTQKSAVVSYNLSAALGQKTITVEFTSPSGQKETKSVNIKVISTDPKIGSVSCNVDLASNGVVFNITGENFGINKGSLVAEGSAKSPNVKEWTDTNISGVLSGSSDKDFRIKVNRQDSRGSNTVNCSVGLKGFQLKANVFCQQIWPFDVSDVELTFVDRNAGGSEAKEKVAIGKDGFIKGVSTKLQTGRNYALAIKAPKSLRTVVNFTATEGTDVIDDVVLPVGDIWGGNGAPDGIINTFDHNKLVSDWGVLRDTGTVRAADFNQDKRVNAVDWACMRKGFPGQGLTETGRDQEVPKPGAQVTYKFNPDNPAANKKFTLTVEDPSPTKGTYDFVALVIDENYKSAFWMGGPGNNVDGPPFVWSNDNGLSAGNHTFRLVGQCAYKDASGQVLSVPDCSGSQAVRFNQVSKTFTGGTSEGLVLKGKVFIDSNGNGQRETGEQPFPNATITLTGQGDPKTYVTNSEGNYEFINLADREYRMSLTMPAGYQRTNDDSVPINPVRQREYDFGIKPVTLTNPGRIVGKVYIDSNRNGSRETGEPAYTQGSVITLTGPNNLNKTFTSNNEGNYEFVDLAAGSYRITLTLPSGYTRSNDNSVILNVTTGDVEYDFGMLSPN